MSFILLAFVANNLRFELLGDDLHCPSPGSEFSTMNSTSVTISPWIAIAVANHPSTFHEPRSIRREPDHFSPARAIAQRDQSRLTSAATRFMVPTRVKIFEVFPSHDAGSA